MINMYSSMMYGSMGMGAMNAQNVHKYFQQRYGCGYEDFGVSPYKQPYPTAVSPFKAPKPCNEFWLCRIVKRILNL